ncbi:2-hydroxyacid dehydrogenase [Plastoroseomonas arctica]|uniref:2-hydroxyacid dehydrogenase n=1 Tax=Plastoroseomonas arctica TaxID=1509237 RepID=A0AAF1JU82_9PROT|nr:2-hydroxyacid dehydrogenase [Plastoroseomonas arctica]MBR0653677.1 2-hydroxyacid dehydrogenase [Plastoroseomonas arctica]
MHVAVFSSKPYDEHFLGAAASGTHELDFLEARLTPQTAVLARGADAVCAFVNDQVNAAVLAEFKALGVGIVALRAAGYNNVDLDAAQRCGITIAYVPAYSPDAVAEHALAMMMALNRNIHRAWLRVREGNFALEGLLGFNMRGRCVGIIGTGRIGAAMVRIMLGMGCRVIAHDPVPDPTLGIAYLPLDAVLAEADILTLHCPLTPATRHLIDAATIARMKRGVMLINTSRGAIVDTAAVIAGLKTGAIGHLGLDVYEEEAGLFFEDKSDAMIGDDVFARLLTFPNVLVTGHQGFFTAEALTAIAQTTIANLAAFAATGRAVHEIAAPSAG